MSSSWSVEVESRAPAVPLFKAAFTNWRNLGPKLIPEVIAGITILSGHGTDPGSIRQIDFTPVAPFSFVKERLEFIDHEKLELKIKLVEGGNLGKKLESATSHIKVEPKGSGSIVKLEVKHQVIHGADVSEDVEKAKEAFIKTIKAVEEYLLANPGTYA